MSTKSSPPTIVQKSKKDEHSGKSDEAPAGERTLPSRGRPALRWFGKVATQSLSIVLAVAAIYAANQQFAASGAVLGVGTPFQYSINYPMGDGFGTGQLEKIPMVGIAITNSGRIDAQVIGAEGKLNGRWVQLRMETPFQLVAPGQSAMALARIDDTGRFVADDLTEVTIYSGDGTVTHRDVVRVDELSEQEVADRTIWGCLAMRGSRTWVIESLHADGILPADVDPEFRGCSAPEVDSSNTDT